MASNFGDILKKLGWEDGFQIPIANDENKALEDELARLAMRKAKAKSILDNVSGRLESLKEHFKYVGQENDHNQKLITAHTQQLETMENQYHNYKSEKVNTQLSIKKIEKQLKDVEDRTSMKKTELQKSVTRADQLKAEMDWDAEALKAWQESLKKRDDDTELIKKFTKEDERRYNELEAKRQHLQSEYAMKRERIAKIAAETNNYELVIERSGKVIRQLITEREALIRQWKDTVKMLQQRDDDIVTVQDRIADMTEAIAKQRDALADENTFLADHQRNNRELETQIENVNVVNSRMKRDFNQLEQNVLLMNGQHQSLKRQVAATAQHLENARIDNKLLVRTLDERERLIELYKGQLKNLSSKLDDIQNTTLSSEERIRRIDKLIDSEEKLYNIFVTDTEKINTLLFRTDQQLKDYKTVGKSLEVQISNTTFNSNQLMKHIGVGKKELEKIKEVVYDMEYRTDELEKRLYSFQDDKQTDKQTNESEKMIQELERTLADHKEVQQALQHQVDRLQEDMRRLSNLIATDKEQYDVLKNKCENYLLVYEIGKKQIEAAKHSTQEKQVEENMMRLRINQIEKEKTREEKHIFTLEKLRLNLDLAMKERQLEIDTKKTIVQAKCRHLEDDRGRLRADIALRRLKIEQIQKKYHIALNSLEKNEDGQPLSVTHFKIKHAQDKFMLQQEGDELDQKIKTAEKEIVAMENTLKLVNLTNSSFKNSLTPVKEEDAEVAELKALADQCKRIDDVLKDHKNRLVTNQTERDELQIELNKVEEEMKRCRDVVSDLNDNIDAIKKQELDKAKMLKRTDCAMKRAIKKLGNVDVSKYIRDFEIRQLQEANKHALEKLLELSSLYREMCPPINRYVMEYGLRLPPKKKTPSTPSSLSSVSNCSSSRVVSVSTFELSSHSTVNTVNLSLQL